MQKKILSVIMLLVLATSVLAGCGSQTETESKEKSQPKTDTESTEKSQSKTDTEEEKVVVNIGEQTDYLWTYAEEKGIVEEVLGGTNIEIVSTFYASGPNMNDAYSAEELDFATMGCQPAISGSASGRGYRFFARFYGQEHNSPLIAATGSGIESIEDLKGKRVGTFVGGTWQYYLNVYLESVGLTQEDVELFNTAAETATAIRSGEIDAAVIGLSTAYILEDEGSAYIVSNEPGTDTANVITARDKFVEEHPEEAKLIVEVYEKAVNAVAEDVESYAKFIANKQELDEEIIVKAYLQNEYKFELGDDDIASLSELYDYMIQNELVEDNGKDFEELINTDLTK